MARLRSPNFVAVTAVLCALVTVLRSVEAGEPANLRTTVLARAERPEDAKQIIAVDADQKKIPKESAKFRFSMTSVPPEVTLQSCAVRVVMAEGIAEGQDNGVLLELQTSEPSQTVAAMTVPPGTPKDTSVVLRSKALCSVLGQNIKGSELSLKLQTTTRNGKVQIYGSLADIPSLAPRLMVAYQVANALPGDADWTQIRRDAQHSGRSSWRMYDPDGSYSPTDYALRPLNTLQAESIETSRDLRQSPILFGGSVITVRDAAPNMYRLTALDRSGKVLREATISGKPKFLAAGLRGRLFYVTENKISTYSLFGAGPFTALEDILTETETVLDVPTVGGDGSLYIVTNLFVHAYSPHPEPRELWRYPTGQDDVGAVALGGDEATAYVLFGGSNPRLVALDSSTGDCRWEQRIEGQTPAQQRVKGIVRGANEAMPILVVAGRTVLVNNHFPTGDELYAFRDAEPNDPGGRGELAPPASCRASVAPGGMTILGGDGVQVPTPMVGPGQEAFYLKGGQLCWSRDEQAEACSKVAECEQEELRKATLLIGDSSGGQSATRLYALDPESKPRPIFFLNLQWQSDAGRPVMQVGCRKATFDDLGPNLILAPDGGLYNYGQSRAIQAVVPKAFASNAKELTLALTADLVEKNNGTTFRVPGAIRTAPDLSLPAGTDIILVAGEQIGFASGFSVKHGARLRAWAGDNYPVQPVLATRKADKSAGPEGYAFCAAENGTCSFSGTKNVAYGANGKFAYKTATNGIACNNVTFGDPIAGTVKACYMK
jgi:hypothetical protein